MLEASLLETLARELDESERTRVQLRHFSARIPGLHFADSYAIQQAWTRRKVARGLKVVGHKIGLTSRAMQIASQITEPDYGALFDDMLYVSGQPVPAARYILPRLEVELGFRLKRALCPAPDAPLLTVDEVLDATECVFPALELIDARIEQFDRDNGAPRKVLDTIADNAASAGVISGGREVGPREVDLRWVGAMLYKNGVIEESGLAAAVLDHPAHGIAWLARKLAPFGEGLAAGELVLAGSFTRPVAAAAGDVFRADYGPLGAIDVTFT